MSKQTINLGTAPAGTGGDTPRSAWVKAQANFDELYARDAALGTAANATLTTSNYDSTAGRVLRVGDFGLGGATGGPTVEPNTAYIPGFAIYPGTHTGGPVPGSGGSLIVNLLGGSYIQQIAQTPVDANASNPGVYVRHFTSSGSPGPWRKFYHTGNTTVAADGTLKAI